MTFVPSGTQCEIELGAQRATVVEVGGGIREYTVDGLEVLESYPRDAMCDGGHGAPLVPWPNRLADGKYTWDGVDQQLALTEPTKRNAIHGLLLWQPWTTRAHEADRVVMGAEINPQSGYPFKLDVQAAYQLTAGGLVVTTTATNIGDAALPYAHGQHPYLSAGVGVLDECTLEFIAATRIDTDEERQLPTGAVPVAGTEFDFSTRRLMGDVAIDFAFTDVARDADGRAWVSLGRPDGSRAELWVDDTYPYVQLFTGETLSAARQRRGLAAEPTTCPPNAFATGEHVIRLEPGASVTSQWGARLTS